MSGSDAHADIRKQLIGGAKAGARGYASAIAWVLARPMTRSVVAAAGVLLVATVGVSLQIAFGRQAVGHDPGSTQPVRLQLRGPTERTVAHTARFRWHGQKPTRFHCRLDHGPPERCHSGVLYRDLSAGFHSFTLIARTPSGRRLVAHGNTSRLRPSWRWYVIPASRLIVVGGEAQQRLYPGGAATPLNLTIQNDSGQQATVTSLSARVSGVRAPGAGRGLSCTTADFATTRYSGPPFTVPEGRSTLATNDVAQRYWPTVRMLDRPVNQDGCLGASITLAYGANWSRERR